MEEGKRRQRNQNIGKKNSGQKQLPRNHREQLGNWKNERNGEGEHREPRETNWEKENTANEERQWNNRELRETNAQRGGKREQGETTAKELGIIANTRETNDKRGETGRMGKQQNQRSANE